MSQRRQHAAMAPADEPQILFSKRYGAYVFKHEATPTWYMPKNPQPENDTFIFFITAKLILKKKNKLYCQLNGLFYLDL